ncbi:MAG: cyclic nucleotide-binding domain-containing protein [Paracoccaceae bacterium]|jgi:CRP-like cAMP-binding protein|nr:cyclic nucleotide-binding domain-containing protein [Paracoccaceae bacterium]MDP5353677.1 cyclic nucleotide-binding domain-containing protein [Paracoccaceae bacterium]|tara:strand:+ start:122 stop:529 length:408 start_codon:yes stop_codon:yes gene_type:complete
MLENLKKNFIQFPLRSGEVLCKESDKSADGYIVLDGIIELTKANSKRFREVTMGEVFGVWEAIFQTNKRFFTATCTTDATVLIIPAKVLRQKVENADPFLSYCFRQWLVLEESFHSIEEPPKIEIMRKVNPTKFI